MLPPLIHHPIRKAFEASIFLVGIIIGKKLGQRDTRKELDQIKLDVDLLKKQKP
jgi:hypothetical protein